MPTILITGTNRGIGLALVKMYITQKYDVIAVCRKSSDALNKTSAQVIEGIDITNLNSLAQLSSRLKGISIDILINNAGQWCNDSIDNLNFDSITDTYNTNTIGTLKTIYSLRNLFNSETKIAIISSKMGSIADNATGGRYGYRMSKAALNAAGKSLSIDFKKYGITVLLIHPGWVLTNMGGPNALITSEESSNGIMNVIHNATIKDSGLFYSFDGTVIDW